VINDLAAGLLGGPADPCGGAGAGPTRVSAGQVRGLLRAAPPSPATLTRLAVTPDGGGQAVEVPSAEGAEPVDGDDGSSGSG